MDQLERLVDVSNSRDKLQILLFLINVEKLKPLMPQKAKMSMMYEFFWLSLKYERKAK